MYSKQENQNLKREFWIAFAEKYPRKWLLYDTKIKDFSFKFFIDNKKAQVLIDIECKDEKLKTIYFEKIVSLQTILENDYIKNLVYQKKYFLETNKQVSRIWIEKLGLNIGNKQNWDMIFDFFNQNMDAFERFFYEYQDLIKDLETNT